METITDKRKTETRKKLKKVFDQRQADVLAEVITDAYNELVKTGDFHELKDIVKDTAKALKELAEAQKRTEIKVEELAEAQKRTEIKVEELAEAQKRTEIKVEELAEAQKRTEASVEELAEAQKRSEKEIQYLVKGLNELRGEVGGLSRSMGYAFENEAYRALPGILKEKYGISIKEKMIRAEIGGKEINIFGKGEMDGKEILVAGEAKLRLDERRLKGIGKGDVFKELEDKVQAITEEYGDVEIVRILITHYATKGFLRNAKERGVIVLQSFEWQARD